MSKYYKAEDVIQAIEEMQNGYNGWSDKFDKAQIIGVLEELPTIDIVRCTECKYAHMTYGGECKYCDKWSLEDSLYLDGDFFCSYGERIEE